MVATIHFSRLDDSSLGDRWPRFVLARKAFGRVDSAFRFALELAVLLARWAIAYFQLTLGDSAAQVLPANQGLAASTVANRGNRWRLK